MIVELFEIVPVGDGSHYLCKDNSGRYFTEHKAIDRSEQLVFDSETVAQSYINKYLDADKYVPELFGYDLDYLPADVITFVDE